MWQFQTFPIPLLITATCYTWIAVKTNTVHFKVHRANGAVQHDSGTGEGGNPRESAGIMSPGGKPRQSTGIMSPGGNPRQSAGIMPPNYAVTQQPSGGSSDKVTRVTIMVMSLVLAHVILTLPAFTINLISSYRVNMHFGSVANDIVILMFFANAAVNPVLYGVFNTNFQRTLRLCPCARHSALQTRVSPTQTFSMMSPSAVNRSPSMVNRSPSVVNRSPSVVNKSPSVVNKSPSVVNKSLCVVNESPSVITKSPGVITKSPKLW